MNLQFGLVSHSIIPSTGEPSLSQKLETQFAVCDYWTNLYILPWFPVRAPQKSVYIPVFGLNH